MSDFPPEALPCRLDLKDQLPQQSQELTLAVMRYLNLCSEEFYLHRRGYLANDIWTIWEGELKRMVRSQLFRREWPELREEYSAYSEFQEFVEAVQNCEG